MKVVYSRLALAELDAILSYISQHSALGAEHVEARIRRAVAHIGEHPHAAEQVPRRPHIRRLPLGSYPYVIYYEVAAEDVTILRILHGARRQPFEPSLADGAQRNTVRVR